MRHHRRRKTRNSLCGSSGISFSSLYFYRNQLDFHVCFNLTSFSFSFFFFFLVETFELPFLWLFRLKRKKNTCLVYFCPNKFQGAHFCTFMPRPFCFPRYSTTFTWIYTCSLAYVSTGLNYALIAYTYNCFHTMRSLKFHITVCSCHFSHATFCS